MTNILQIGSLFLAQLGFGSALILPFFPLKVTGKSFVQFYYGFILLLMTAFMFSLYRVDQFHTNYLVFAAVALWIFALSFTKNFSKTETMLLWFYGFCSLILLFVYPHKAYFPHTSLQSYTVSFFFLLSSTIFLSFHMMNMIFGHWYLVNRELPIQHLITTCRNLIAFTYLRIITVGIATYMAYSQMDTVTFNRLIDFMGHGIFFWARILAGLGIPLLVSHLAYESAKIHSNQSATGILYAGTVFVLMGEIMALYLFTITGIFF